MNFGIKMQEKRIGSIEHLNGLPDDVLLPILATLSELDLLNLMVTGEAKNQARSLRNRVFEELERRASNGNQAAIDTILHLFRVWSVVAPPEYLFRPENVTKRVLRFLNQLPFNEDYELLNTTDELHRRNVADIHSIGLRIIRNTLEPESSKQETTFDIKSILQKISNVGIKEEEREKAFIELHLVCMNPTEEQLEQLIVWMKDNLQVDGGPVCRAVYEALPYLMHRIDDQILLRDFVPKLLQNLEAYPNPGAANNTANFLRSWLKPNRSKAKLIASVLAPWVSQQIQGTVFTGSYKIAVEFLPHTLWVMQPQEISGVLRQLARNLDYKNLELLSTTKRALLDKFPLLTSYNSENVSEGVQILISWILKHIHSESPDDMSLNLRVVSILVPYVADNAVLMQQILEWALQDAMVESIDNYLSFDIRVLLHSVLRNYKGQAEPVILWIKDHLDSKSAEQRQLALELLPDALPLIDLKRDMTHILQKLGTNLPPEQFHSRESEALFSQALTAVLSMLPYLDNKNDEHREFMKHVFDPVMHRLNVGKDISAQEAMDFLKILLNDHKDKAAKIIPILISWIKQHIDSELALDSRHALALLPEVLSFPGAQKDMESIFPDLLNYYMQKCRDIPVRILARALLSFLLYSDQYNTQVNHQFFSPMLDKLKMVRLDGNHTMPQFVLFLLNSKDEKIELIPQFMLWMNNCLIPHMGSEVLNYLPAILNFGEVEQHRQLVAPYIIGLIPTILGLFDDFSVHDEVVQSLLLLVERGYITAQEDRNTIYSLLFPEEYALVNYGDVNTKKLIFALLATEDIEQRMLHIEEWIHSVRNRHSSFLERSCLLDVLSRWMIKLVQEEKQEELSSILALIEIKPKRCTREYQVLQNLKSQINEIKGNNLQKEIESIRGKKGPGLFSPSPGPVAESSGNQIINNPSVGDADENDLPFNLSSKS